MYQNQSVKRWIGGKQAYLLILESDDSMGDVYLQDVVHYPIGK